MHARLALALVIAVFAAGAANAESHRWQRVLSGERKVGQVELTRREADGRVFETEVLTIELGAPGRRTSYRAELQNESTPDGSLLRSMREVRTREGHSRVEARVVDGNLEVSNGAGRARRTESLTGAAAMLKADSFAQSWLAAVGRGEAREPLIYSAWDPVKQAVVEIVLSTLPKAEGTQVERRVRSSTQVTASLQTVDMAGNVVRESMRLGSLALTLVDSSEDEARVTNEVLDHVGEQLQKAPYRIPARDMRSKIRYGFDNHGTPPQIPVGAGQRSWTEGQTTFIQVCAECAIDALDLPATLRERALQPTPWLQSDDPKLARRAAGLTAGTRDAVAKMKRLTRFVRERMSVEKIDMLGYGTAREALESGHGDCTEYAVLLAALGRAAGVPTRVAIGRVYARHFEGRRHVFVPHAWVQAWTGTGWESFDAAIGSFDSTHLAFAVNYDGSPAVHFQGANLAHELTLISAARVVPRKGAAN